MNTMLINNKLRKALKVAGVAFCVLVLMRILLMVYVATQPDAPPFDDSDMLPRRPDISSDENGFDALMKSAGLGENLPDGYYDDLNELKDRDSREVDRHNLESLKRIYDARYRRMRKALKYPYLVSPPNSYLEVRDVYSANVINGMRAMTRYALACAWHEARAGNQRQALKHIEFVMRLGYDLQNSHGDLLYLMLGTSAQENALKETNTMLDSGLLSDEAIPELIKMFNDFAPDPKHLEQTIKCLYEFSKSLNHAMQSEQVGFIERIDNRIAIRQNIMLKIYYDQHKFMAGQARMPLKDVDKNQWRVPHKKSGYFEEKLSAWTRPSQGIARIVMSVAMPNYFRSFERYALHRTEWRMIQTKLAILSYYSEHGKLPESLDAITPLYIKVIPIDPMDGKTLRYDAKKGIIWSVGFNFKNDSGTADHFLFKEDTDMETIKKEKDIVLQILPNS